STVGLPAPSVTIRADPTVLASPGVYYALVRVSSQGAADAPQDVEVVLNLLGPGSYPGAVVSRSGLIFVAPAGISSPGSQTITITNLAASPLAVSPSASTFEGTPWLTVAPNAAQQQIPAAGGMKLVIAATVDRLPPGVHQGTVLLQFPSP